MLTRPIVFRALIVGLSLFASASGRAQQPLQGPDGTVDSAARAQVIEGMLSHLKTAYVFPETAAKMSEAIRARVERKEYDGITSARAFADALTQHLQEVSHDKHLRVIYSSDPIPDRRVPSADD